MNERDALIFNSQRPQRKAPLEIDEVMFEWQHLVGNFFCNLKDFRRIAMRSDKTDTSFSAMIHACAALLKRFHFKLDQRKVEMTHFTSMLQAYRDNIVIQCNLETL